jgi:phage terminase large subunit GpA-like protein
MSAPSSTALPISGPGLDDDVFPFDGARDLLRAWSRGIRPDPGLTVSEWADRHRWLSSRASAEPGRYRTARTPYMREIMDRLSPSDAVDLDLSRTARRGKPPAERNPSLACG